MKREMRSVKMSAAEAWRLSKIEEESDSNPSSPFKKLHVTTNHTGGRPNSPQTTSPSHTNSSEDDGYERVPNSKEEWEAMKREALAAEKAVKAIKSKYDSLERTRKQTTCNSPLMHRFDNKDRITNNHKLSLDLPLGDQVDDDWSNIPLPPPHILNNSLSSPTHNNNNSLSSPTHNNNSSLSSPTHNNNNPLPSPPHFLNISSTSPPRIVNNPLPSPPTTSRVSNIVNNTPIHKNNSSATSQQHNLQQSLDQQLNQHKQQNKVQQLSYHHQPQQKPQHSQQQLNSSQPQQQEQQQQRPKHLLTPHEILQMETFYKGLNTHVSVCDSTATLLRRIVPNTRSSDNKPVISSPICIENEWKMVKEGVPMFVLDPGDLRRQRRLQLVLAERGTGFPVWKDLIDHLSHYQPLSDRLHTLRSSTDHSNLLAIFFPNQTSAAFFYRSYQLLIENNHDILQISKKKKKKAPPPTPKVPIRKTDISQPCCFTHITKVESVNK